VNVAHLTCAPPDRIRQDFRRWKRRSRLIRVLRIALPGAIALILAAMVGFVVQNAVAGARAPENDPDAPIQLVNPRFVGRDDKGRAYVLTAVTATRDPKEYQRVVLDQPSLIFDEEGDQPLRITARSGVFHEERRTLNLDGGVKLNGGDLNFDTASSIFDTATGELKGSGQIQGSGALGEIIAKSYGVYDKGDRMVFKGGVRTRIN
jgi:lipopolysaccharide export system protein LptC